jgi:DNA-binding MarR family transcriptional regulator
MGKYISILYRQEQRHMNQVVQQYGLGPSSYNFLLCLAANEGASQKQLCERMLVDEAIATRAMKKLEEQGFITRQKDRNDLRCYALHLTEQGRAIIPILQASLQDWWTTLTQDFPAEDSEKLLAQCEQMTQKAILKNQEINPL